jgi:hypothetical protein
MAGAGGKFISTIPYPLRAVKKEFSGGHVMADTEEKRSERIAQRRSQIPKIHRANYDEAVSGKSRKAAIKAFCLECVCWQKEEVRLCTALACPLYSYRPYQEGSNDVDNRTGLGAESTKSGGGKI